MKFLMRLVALLVVIVTAGCGGSSVNPTAPTPTSPVVTTPPTPSGTLVGQIVFKLGYSTTGGVAKTIPASRPGELRVRVSIAEMEEVPLRVLRLSDLNSTVILSEHRFSSSNGIGEVAFPFDGKECLLVLQNLGSIVIHGGAQIFLF